MSKVYANFPRDRRLDRLALRIPRDDGIVNL